MEFTSFFDKLLVFYKVKSVTDLADKLNVTRSTVSGWKSRQAVGAILEYLFNNDLKALHYIFGNDYINNFENSTNVVAQDFSNNNNSKHTQNIGNKSNTDENILKLIDLMYSSAQKNNKVDELKTDLATLLSKYI